MSGFRCPKCGNLCSIYSKFCNKCGEKIEVFPYVCRECGLSNNPWATFCERCGHELGDNQNILPNSSQTQQQNATARAQSNLVFWEHLQEKRQKRQRNIIILVIVLFVISFLAFIYSDDDITVPSHSESSSSGSSSGSAPSSASSSIAKEPLFKVDWKKAIEQTKADRMKDDYYSVAMDYIIGVDEEKKEISFQIVLKDEAEPTIALEYANDILRYFNTVCSIQDFSITTAEENYYGELYDYYDAVLGIYPKSETNNVEKWFVYDKITAGQHTSHALKLQKYYQEPIDARKEWIGSQFKYNGSHLRLEKLIIKNLNDEKSYKHIGTKYVDVITENEITQINGVLEKAGYYQRVKKGDLFIITEFSAKNVFNATIKQTAYGISYYDSNEVELIAIE